MMSGEKNHTGLTKDMKPANQTGEEKGTIKGPQRTDRNTQTTDTPQGSEVETRSASHRRVSDQG
jgi:hypothetical protein